MKPRILLLISLFFVLPLSAIPVIDPPQERTAADARDFLDGVWVPDLGEEAFAHFADGSKTPPLVFHLLGAPENFLVVVDTIALQIINHSLGLESGGNGQSQIRTREGEVRLALNMTGRDRIQITTSSLLEGQAASDRLMTLRKLPSRLNGQYRLGMRITDNPQHRMIFNFGRAFKAGNETAAPSASSGTVLRAGIVEGFGGFVLIDHGNGVATGYMPLARLLVSEGDHILPGQVLGFTTNTAHWPLPESVFFYMMWTNLRSANPYDPAGRPFDPEHFNWREHEKGLQSPPAVTPGN